MPRWSRFSGWFVGLLALAATVTVALRLADVERFAHLALQANPMWLFAGLLIQTLTYVSDSAVWYYTLDVARHHVKLRKLVPLGIAKLFADQALPSLGLGGVIVVASGLASRGIDLDLSVTVLMVSQVTYFAAYVIVTLTSVGILWLLGQWHWLFLVATVLLTVVAGGMPALLFWVRRVGAPIPPVLLRHLPLSSTLLQALRTAPMDLFRNPVLIARGISLQALVFLLDACTFWFAFLSIGVSVSPFVVLASFIMASVAATLGPLPMGLGSFEAVSVAMLILLNVPLEAALVATLLFRGLTFWLPMLPGILLLRREMHPRTPSEPLLPG